MSDQETPSEVTTQFDRVITALTSSVRPGRPRRGLSHRSTWSIPLAGHLCSRFTALIRCQDAAKSFRLIIAGCSRLGAGVVGAGIYYAVIAIAHVEVGIVAILIGYMVGYAVRKGARGRGGLRFQVVAVALTYASVALAYAPIAVKGLAPGVGASVFLMALIAALPVMVVLGSFQSGLILVHSSSSSG
jgi:hypothetical protein